MDAFKRALVKFLGIVSTELCNQPACNFTLIKPEYHPGYVIIAPIICPFIIIIITKKANGFHGNTN